MSGQLTVPVATKKKKRTSQIYWDQLSELEGDPPEYEPSASDMEFGDDSPTEDTLYKAYHPGEKFTNSGVTLGNFALDVGQFSANELRAGNVDEALVQKLSHTFGKKGKEAADLADTIYLTQDEQDKLDSFAKSVIEKKAVKQFKGLGRDFYSFSAAEQSIAISLTHQFGYVGPRMVSAFGQSGEARKQAIRDELLQYSYEKNAKGQTLEDENGDPRLAFANRRMAEHQWLLEESYFQAPDNVKANLPFVKTAANDLPEFMTDATVDNNLTRKDKTRLEGLREQLDYLKQSPEEYLSTMQQITDQMELDKVPPAAARVLVASPEKMKAASKSMPEISAAETALTLNNPVSEWLIGTGGMLAGNITEVFGQAFQAPGTMLQLIRDGIQAPLEKALELLGFEEFVKIAREEREANPWWTNPVEATKLGGEAIKGFAKELRPDAPDMVQEIFGGIAQMSAQWAVYLTNPTLGLSALYQAGEDQVEDIIKMYNLEPDDFRLAKVFGGIVTATSEKFGLDMVFKHIPKSARNRFVKMLMGASSEIIQETIENLGHDLVVMGMVNPAHQPKLLSAREAGVVGAVGGIVSAFLPGRQRAVKRSLEVDAAIKTIVESEMAQNNPELAAELLHEMIVNEKGIEEVTVEAEPLIDWMKKQDGGVAQTASVLEIADQMDAILENGTPAKISGRVLAETVGMHPNYSSIKQHIRFEESLPTIDEYQKLVLENQQAILDKLEEYKKSEPTLAARVGKFVESFKKADLKPEDIVKMLNKAPGDVSQALDTLIDQIQSEQLVTENLKVEARLTAIDNQLKVKDEKLAKLQETINEREAADKPNVANEKSRQVLIRDIGILEDEQAKLEIPNLKPALRPAFRAALAQRGVPGPETVTTPAIEIDGKIYTGQTHPEALNNALDAGVIEKSLTNANTKSGFLTNKGRLLTRDEAIALMGLEKNRYTGEGLTAEKLLAIQAANPDAVAIPITAASATVETKAGKLDSLGVKIQNIRIRETRKAFKKALSESKKDMKLAQATLTKLLQDSGLSDKAKFRFSKQLKMIGDTQELAKRLPKIQLDVMNQLDLEKGIQQREAIKTLLKRYSPKVDSTNTLKGKLRDAKTTDIIYALKKKAFLSKKAAGEELLNVRAGADGDGITLARANEDSAGDFFSGQQVLENAILEMTADPRGTSSAFYEGILLDIKAIVDEGIDVDKSVRFREDVRMESIRNALLEAIGPEPKAARTKSSVGWSNFKGKWWLGYSGVWKGKLSDVMSTANAALHDSIQEELSLTREARVHEQNRRQSVQKVTELLTRYTGLNANKLLKRQQADFTNEIDLGKHNFADHVDEEGNFVKQGDYKEVLGSEGKKFTKGELRQKVMELMNDDIRAIAFDAQNEGYTEAIFEEMKSKLDDVDWGMIRAQNEFYNEFYPRINEVYQRMNGVTLPKVDQYVPISRQLLNNEQDQFLKASLYRGGVSPGSLKMRVQNRFKLKVRNDMEVMQTHMMEMEYYIAYAEKVKHINRVFSSDHNAVMNRILETSSKSVQRTIQNDLVYFTNKGVTVSQTGELVLVKLMRNFGLAQLGAKPQIGLKQLVSFSAMSENVKAVDFASGLAEYLSNPKAANKWLSERSVFYAERGLNLDHDFQQLTADSMSPGVLNFMGRNPRFTSIMMMPIKLGDRQAIAAGGYAHVKAKMKAGMSEADAIQSFEQLANDTQQSQDPDKISEMQRASSLIRVMAQFMSSANAITRGEIRAITERSKGRIDNGEFAKRMFVYHLLIPNLIQLASNGFSWDDEDQLQASFLGSWNGLFLIGDVIEMVVGLMANEIRENPKDVFKLSTRHPLQLFDALRKFTLENAEDLLWEDIMEESKFLDGAADLGGAMSGIPLKTLLNQMRGFDRAIKGESKEAIALGLGYSPYIIEQQEIGE